MPVNISDIFHGTSKAPVKDYIGAVVREWQPVAMFHPCVGKFGALGACIKGGVDPHRHWSSDLNLFTSVIGVLADPKGSIHDLNLVPNDEVQRFFTDADPADELNFAARVLLGMKYVQLEPKNRYMESIRRDLRVDRDRHVESLQRRLTNMVASLEGIHYRAANLWDVLAELEADPPSNPKTMLYMSMNWYEGDFGKQMGRAEEAFQWPGLVGREFVPDMLGELLERADAIPNLTTVAHCGSPVAHLVPQSFHPVMAYMGGRGEVDHLYANDDLIRYAPSPIRKLDAKDVLLFDDTHELTKESKLEVVHIDGDTALMVRDLFVHRLGASAADTYYAMTLDGRIAAVFGLMLVEVLGAGHPTAFIKEQFGVVVTSQKYPRLNRLSPLALTSGDMRRTLMRDHPALQLRDVEGMQTTDIRRYKDSKNKRGVYTGYSTEQQRDGTWKIISRGRFRDDTWADCFKVWWDKWSLEAVEARREEEREREATGRKRRRRPQARPTA